MSENDETYNECFPFLHLRNWEQRIVILKKKKEYTDSMIIKIVCIVYLL